jgi:uncharacterized protein YecT (DUF1311 family)
MRLVFVFVVLASFGAGAQAQQIDCANAITQLDMTDCAKQDFDAADTALNESYQAAMEMMNSIDADLPYADQGAVEALKAAQRAWILVRDNTCIAEGFSWAGGSGRGMVELSCMARLTKSRTDDLNILAEPY